MITKEQNYNRNCLFCASDYHLEMILLPYIIEKKDKYKTIVFTESNLEVGLSKIIRNCFFLQILVFSHLAKGA